MYNKSNLSNPLMNTKEPTLPNFSKYIDGTPLDKEKFLASFKSGGWFTKIQDLFKRIKPEWMVFFETEEAGNFSGELLLKWVAEPLNPHFTALEKQAMIGFTALIATESFSKLISGSQGTNLSTCSAVPPILSCFTHYVTQEDGDVTPIDDFNLKPLVGKTRKLHPLTYDNWQYTNPKALPYLMGKGLGGAIQNKDRIAKARDELYSVGQLIGDDKLAQLLTPPNNKVYFPRNLYAKDLPEDCSAETYNSLGYFERCMLTGFWLFKHKHPLMLRDPENWGSKDDYAFSFSIQEIAPTQDHSWMNLFNSVKIAPEVDKLPD